MRFNLVIDTKGVVSFQLPKNGVIWGHKLDMEFDLPCDWTRTRCHEYVSQFIKEMGVVPFNNLTSYEEYVDSATLDFNAAADHIASSAAVEIGYSTSYDKGAISFKLSLIKEEE